MKPTTTTSAATAIAMLATTALLIAAAPKHEPHQVESATDPGRPIESSTAGTGFHIAWSTIDSGGGTSTNANGFELSGTIGQHDAGNAVSEAFELSGGYWSVTITRTTPPCPGDLNNDNQVNAADLGILLTSFGSSDGGDLNGDGITNAADLGILLAAFGGNCD